MHMLKRPIATGKHIALSVLAMVLGIITAVALSTGYVAITGWQTLRSAQTRGADLLLPLDAQIDFAFQLSTLIAIVTALVCVPIWMLLAALKRDGAIAAAILGFVLPLPVMMGLDQNIPAAAQLLSGLPFAVCGAVAGLVTWHASPNQRTATGLFKKT